MATEVRASFLACLLLLGAAGCRAEGKSKPPITVDQAAARSELGTEVHRLIDAMRTRSVSDLRPWMTPELRSRVSLATLATAAQQLHADFGEPVGILEEHAHTEGELRWYSGLVVYATEDRQGKLTPVLYQFAQDQEGKLARLLVREHWFLQQVEPPADDYVPINRFRLPGRGRWYVLHGGRRRTTNYHHGSKTQRFAYDLIKKKKGRQRPAGSDDVNSAYYAHGEDLLAPAAGVVVTVRDGVPENQPGERGRGGGNGVVIDHGFGEYSALWHAIPGTIRVEVGDEVVPGQLIGKVGNSGRSTGPHIHFHVAYRPRDDQEAFGLPVDFHDVYVDDLWYPHAMPVRGQYLRSAIELRQEKLATGPRLFVDG